ncbi:MAG: NAD-dependent epimerase/dehydratase family protein [Candidatus Micrarchaeia archaeon]
MARILVTGASGRLGSAIIKALSPGNEIVAMVQQADKPIEGVKNFAADITSKQSIDSAFEGIDTVIHLAGIVSQYRFGKKAIMNVNVNGTKNVVDACKEHGVKRIVFASSVDVYGSKRKDVLNESSETKPSDYYGKSKLLAEQAIMGSDMQYAILRMAAIYGPGFEGSFFKVFNAIAKRKAYIIGSGSNNLALLHINDAISAFSLSAITSSSGIYNISDGNSYTQLQLYSIAAKMLGVEYKFKHINQIIAMIIARLKGFDIDELRFITSNRVIDISKAKKELGFTPKVSIMDGGSELVNLFKTSGRQNA